MQPIDNNLTFGIGLNAPFGLTTEYDDNWVGRYHALLSEIETININPGLGYKLSERVSIGGGINVQMVDARLTNAVDFGVILGGAGSSQTLDGESDLDAGTSSVEFNVGGLVQCR